MARMMKGGLGAQPKPVAPVSVGGQRPSAAPSGVKPAGVTTDTEVPGVAQNVPSAAWGQSQRPAVAPPGARYGVGLGGTPPGRAVAGRTTMPTPVAGVNVMKDMIEGSKSKSAIADMDEVSWKRLLQKFGSFD